MLQPGLKKGKWSSNEDDILRNWVAKNGACKWSKLSLLLPGRCSKQIRDRWINNLNPERENFKWTEEIENQLLIGYLTHGTSWVSIAKTINGSSENMIKNRFYSMLRSLASRHCKKTGTKPEVKKIVKQAKHNNLDELFHFDDNISSTGSQKKTKYKRNNHNLNYLLEFLPVLLEERGIDVNQYSRSKISNDIIALSGLKPDTSFKTHTYNNLEMNNQNTNFSTEQKTILNNFFNTLSQKVVPREEISLNNPATQFKIKSSILFNLQLKLLHKIFERFRCQLIQRFFEDFRSKTADI